MTKLKLLLDAMRNPARWHTEADGIGGVTMRPGHGDHVAFTDFSNLLDLADQMSKRLEAYESQYPDVQVVARSIHEHMQSIGGKGAASKVFAEAFSAELKSLSTVNYIEYFFDSVDPAVGPLTVTLQRRQGLSPHQLRTQAEVSAEFLRGLLIEFLAIDDWTDDQVAPAELISRVRAAVKGPASQVMTLSRAVLAIVNERYRQVQRKDYSLESDASYQEGELASAACAYLRELVHQVHDGVAPGVSAAEFWPWAPEYWRPGTPERCAEKGGALLLAQLEQLLLSADADDSLNAQGEE